jgi:hypothetical protein
MKSETRLSIIGLLIGLGGLVVGIKQCQLAQNPVEAKKKNDVREDTERGKILEETKSTPRNSTPIEPPVDRPPTVDLDVPKKVIKPVPDRSNPSRPLVPGRIKLPSKKFFPEDIGFGFDEIRINDKVFHPEPNGAYLASPIYKGDTIIFKNHKTGQKHEIIF